MSLFNALCTLGVYGERLRIVNRFNNHLPLSHNDQIILDRMALDHGIGTVGEYKGAGLAQIRYVIHLLDDEESDDETIAILGKLESAVEKVDPDKKDNGLPVEVARRLFLRLIEHIYDEIRTMVDAVVNQLNEGTDKP